MHIFTNLKRFLYDNEDFMAFFKNKIYLYNLKRIGTISNESITIYFDNKKVVIKGKNLKPIQCKDRELLLEGSIESVSLYE